MRDKRVKLEGGYAKSHTGTLNVSGTLRRAYDCYNTSMAEVDKCECGTRVSNDAVMSDKETRMAFYSCIDTIATIKTEKQRQLFNRMHDELQHPRDRLLCTPVTWSTAVGVEENDLRAYALRLALHTRIVEGAIWCLKRSWSKLVSDEHVAPFRILERPSSSVQNGRGASSPAVTLRQLAEAAFWLASVCHGDRDTLSEYCLDTEPAVIRQISVRMLFALQFCVRWPTASVIASQFIAIVNAECTVRGVVARRSSAGTSVTSATAAIHNLSVQSVRCSLQLAAALDELVCSGRFYDAPSGAELVLQQMFELSYIGRGSCIHTWWREHIDETRVHLYP